MPYQLTDEQRGRYREISRRAQRRKLEMIRGVHAKQTAGIEPAGRLDPADLMPLQPRHGLSALSLFSGGGGLDLGFERAGFDHRASFEILDICGETLRWNRPAWSVCSGPVDGDVMRAPFSKFRGVDVVHGGPPCQPFSTAGKQAGENDVRNMWPQFIRCVRQARPRAFVAENVPGMLDRKFETFVQQNIIAPLSDEYTVFKFRLSADDFGVPQARKRVFFVGFRAERDAARFAAPRPTHGETRDLFGPLLPRNLTRQSLGLPDIGFDCVSPTLRSGFTGPRKTTGVVNSQASLKTWASLGIWPNGVQSSRAVAQAFVPENGHHRMTLDDCALLQGFPADWKFAGAVYQGLGQIGNSVCPPVAYAVAVSVARALGALD
ncbi:MAG TPA: DNA (cytosine-5-)-methyltransferase [Rubrivivax sp.]|nr:DNA (cytosine-5-)-methyltransferase [Rubrivivax sp.]HPO20175.1 DNA (cytosine-5-)-methyltransferase [Rubrivivax sp.]